MPEVPTPGQTTPAGQDPTFQPPGSQTPGSSTPGGPGSEFQTPGGPGSEFQTPGGPGSESDAPTGQGSGGPGDIPPGTTPTTPGQEETVTIDDGDRSISVTSPDGQGQVTVTVDDGSGEPKTYTLDFGESGGPAGSQAFGPEGTQGAQGTEGAGGPGNQAPTLDGPIEPGEDGKCVIQDGELTITAERPEGSADTVTVTVDDGTGEPTTYSLDFSADGGPTATPQDQPGQAGQPGQPSEAQTLYRQLDDRLDGVISDLDQRGPAEPAYAATTAQASLPDGGGGGGGGSFFANPDGGAGGQAGSFGLPDQGQGQYTATPSTGSGEAGLASAADGGNGTGNQGGGQHAGGAMGGMPMMGGPAGTSGDQDRGAAGQWRTTGDLFDDEIDAQLRGAFGEGR